MNAVYISKALWKVTIRESPLGSGIEGKLIFSGARVLIHHRLAALQPERAGLPTNTQEAFLSRSCNRMQIRLKYSQATQNGRLLMTSELERRRWDGAAPPSGFPIQKRDLRDSFINAVEEFRIYAERESRTDISVAATVGASRRGWRGRLSTSEAMFVSAAAPLFPGRRGVSW